MENKDLLAPNKSTLQSRIEKVRKYKDQFKTSCVGQGSWQNTDFKNWLAKASV